MYSSNENILALLFLYEDKNKNNETHLGFPMDVRSLLSG